MAGALMGLVMGITLGMITIRKTNAAGLALIYFNPASANLPPNQTLSLMIDTGGSALGFARVDVYFDKAKVNLVGAIQTTTKLTNIATLSGMLQANSTGHISIGLGLSPADAANPPTGVFELAKLPFTTVTANPDNTTNITVSTIPGEVQLVDMQANLVNYDSSPAVLTLNFTIVTLTPTPMPTPTIIPTLTPTPIVGSASLTLQGSSQVVLGNEWPVDINLNTNMSVSGVDAVINFDPAKLSYVRTDDAKLLSGSTIVNTGTSGKVRISQVDPPGLGYSGQGKIATVVFKTLVLGSIGANLEYQPGVTNESNVIELAGGSDILNSVNGANVLVIGGGVYN